MLSRIVIPRRRIYGLAAFDVVLVGADSIKNLNAAYPNYFLDIKESLRYLDKISANV